ncbi:MAG: hypothetical protein K1X48_01875 [Burkholderiaceae bacterium]|nr:hypothetical protein [Burkholderiaceae bacterium]
MNWFFKLRIFVFSFFSISTVGVSINSGHAEVIIQNNEQNAEVTGGIINEAGSGSNAKMNVSSVTQKQKIINNKQKAEIKGVILNSAQNGASSIVNIASKTQTSNNGKQLVQVNGNIVNTASGRGVTSEVTIGNK